MSAMFSLWISSKVPLELYSALGHGVKIEDPA